MRNSARNVRARGVFAAMTFVLGTSVVTLDASVAGAQTPSPAPSATASASPAASAKPGTKASAAPESRTAIVSCRTAQFYAWPDRTTVPSGTSYPPARLGDAFGVIGSGQLTNNGMNLTETTIDVVQPFGSGKHYWIATECVT